ncbi:MAG: type II toxin-antitoxin system HipA family toxin [Campylobacterota bacterium]|nr:type II toxin-antitoxin system HipA family toxin [Campylobacterota bacterium]
MINKDKIILDLFEVEPQLNKKEIELKTDIKGSTLNNILKSLVESNQLNRFGKGRATYYQRVYSSKFSYKNITVLNEGIVIGEMRFGDGKYIFSYDKNYKGNELIGIPRSNLPYESSELFFIFENLIPESHRRAKHLNIENFDDIADSLTTLLNTHGVYEFVYTYELFKYKKSSDKRPSYITIKNKLLDNYSYPNVLQYSLDIESEILDDKSDKDYSSLSGYQNKIDINIDDNNKSIHIDTKNPHYLLKPFNKNIGEYFGDKNSYYPQVLVNEHLFMSFAKIELGFDVPMNALIYHNNNFHYIIKRFDRYKEFRYEQYDFGQLLNISSLNKYNSSSDELFRKANEVLKTKSEKIELLRFYFYSYIIQHGDLHAKNIAVLNIGKETFTLSPLYDVISLGVIKGTNTDDLALPIRRVHKTQKSKFALEDFLYLADILELNHLEVKKEFKSIVIKFMNNFPNYIEDTKKLLVYDDLSISKTRHKKTNLLSKLQSFYDERIIALKKVGIFEELMIGV